MRAITATIAVAIMLAGCAHNSARFVEVTPDGTRTEFRQANIVTWGSTLDEGSGDMSYSWGGDGSGALAVGNAAQGAVSGDPSDVLLGVVRVLLEGYMARLVAPQPEPGPNILDILEALPRAP
jgi:hypothetical protein